MWNGHSNKSSSRRILVALCGLLYISCEVKASYNTGAKTTVYSTDPQITTQIYTTHHRTHHDVPVSGECQYTHNHNNLGTNGNDNDYQTTVTHQSRGSASQWVPSSSSSASASSYGSHSHAHQQQNQQHEGNYHPQQHEQQQHYQQYQQQQQPIYERGHASQNVQHSGGKWQTGENAITDYYTGCPSGHTGQLPYAYDCRRFLNCWKGRGYIQSCSVGTVFNPETLECDRPDKVKCGAPAGATQTATNTYAHRTQPAPPNNRAGRFTDTSADVDIRCPAEAVGLQPHPSDCTKFINCANGNAHIQDCGPGTAFSIPMKVCDFKANVDCSGRGNRAEVNVRQGKSRIACPSDESGLYPHPHDCTKFLQCAHGQTYIQDCGPGTGFDSVHLVCDYKEKVNCTSVRSNGEHSTTEFEASSKPSVECPRGVTGLYPHPLDCNKFLQCSNGQTYIQNCGPGTAFDGVRLLCDYKEKVQCGLDSIWGSTNVITNDHVPNQQTTPSAPSDDHSDMPHNADIFCLDGITGLFAHPFDYTKFINCKNGNTAIQNCVQGTAFSISKGYCESLDHIHKTDHVMYIVSEVSYEYSQTLITCPPGTEGIHLYPFDAEKYIKCVRSQMEVVSCSSSQVFSVTRRTCLPLGEVLKYERVRLLSEIQKSNSYSETEEQYDVHTIVQCPLGLSGTFPYPFDDSKYLRCGGGRMVRESCASGEAYSLSRKECDMMEDIIKNDRVPKTQMAYGPEWRVSDMETIYASTDGLTYFMCPSGLSGYFLHPFDCTKYIECSNGDTRIETCLNGAVYSISRQECIPRDKVEDFDRGENFTTTHVRHLANAQYPTEPDYPNVRLLQQETIHEPRDHLKLQDGPQSLTVSQGHVSPPPVKVDDQSNNNLGPQSQNNDANHLISQPPKGDTKLVQKPVDPSNHEIIGYVPQMPKTMEDFQSPIQNGSPSHINVPKKVEETFNDAKGYEANVEQVHQTQEPEEINAVQESDKEIYFESEGFVSNIGQVQQSLLLAELQSQANQSKHHMLPQSPVQTNGLQEPDEETYEDPAGCNLNIGQVQQTENDCQSTLHYVSELQINDPQSEGILCPKDVKGIFPYPFRRGQYIECSNSDPRMEVCPTGKHFSISKSLCESPTNVPTNETESVIYRVYTCPTGVNGTFFYPFDASKYIECMQTQTILRYSCPPDHYYSISQRSCLPKICILPYDAVGTLGEFEPLDNETAEVLFEQTSQIQCPLSVFGVFPHPFNNTEYIKCFDGRLVIKSCRHGFLFSLSRKFCIKSELSDTAVPRNISDVQQIGQEDEHSPMFIESINSTVLNCPPGVTDTFIYPFLNTRYVNCSNGVTAVETCSNEQVYVIPTKRCMVRSQVQDHEYVEGVERTLKTLWNDDILGVICGSDSNGTYAHPEDFRKYVICSNGVITVERCSEDKIFDLESLECT